jgi:hypothetical protein
VAGGGRTTATYLLGRDGPLADFPELIDGFRVATEILLAPDEDNGKAVAEVHHLRDPLQHSFSR